MPFNPCGFKVQYLRQEGMDVIRPFLDSDIEVTRRWYRAADDAPWLPFPSVFRSTRWEPFPYLRAGVGSVWPASWRFKRVGILQGFDYTHFCGAESDFQGGTLFDPARAVVYDDEWIPDCCGRLSVCVTQLCSQDQENARPAAQLRSYPIPHQDATGTTPVVIQHWPSRAVPGDPSWPGYGFEWWPAGEDGARALAHQVVADELGQLQYQHEEWLLPGGLTMAETRDADGYTLLLDNGVDAGTLTAKIVGGVLEICGTNCVICAALMPTGVAFRFSAPLTGGFPAQVSATPLGTGSFILNSTIVGGQGYILPAVESAEVDVFAIGGVPPVIYPPVGEVIYGHALNAPAILAAGSDPAGPFCYRFVRYTSAGVPLWTVEKYHASNETTSVGTVTSVDLDTSSAGLTVGGGPITGSGTLTVDLAPDLEQLVGFPAADAILTGDGAGNWVPVTIGAYLAYAGQVLDVIPPTATNGEIEIATFNVTGTSGTYQATGTTFTIADPGTYLITGKIRGAVQPGTTGSHSLHAKLRNNTGAAFVALSETQVATSATNAALIGTTAGFTKIVTIAASTTFELYAARIGTTFTISAILSDANGRTLINWTRLA